MAVINSAKNNMNSDFNSQNLSIKRLLTTPIPKQLWHYTSYDSLQKIVESKQIWATDLRFLNEHQELRHAIELCQRLAEQIPASDKYSELVREAAKPIIQSIFHVGPLSSERRQLFVASFSEAEDQLSQWRAYSRASSGVSISFDLSLFRPPNEIETTVVFAPCVYDDAQKMILLEQAFTPFIEALNQWIEDTKEVVRANPKLVDEVNNPLEFSKHVKAPALNTRLLNAAARVNFNLIRICPLLKHSKFSEEAEWRLILPVFSKKMLQQQARKFRPVRDTLIPYLAYPLPANEDGSISLNNVIVGPGSHNEARAAISSFLESNNLLVLPRLSEIPYRPW